MSTEQDGENVDDVVGHSVGVFDYLKIAAYIESSL